MADNEIIIDVEADTRGVNRSLGKLEGDAKKSGKSIGAGFSKAFTVGLVAATAAIAGLAVGLRKAVSAASIQEDAINALNQSLASAGTFSNEASKSFQEFARSMQRTTVFGDELILQQAALARNFARTNEEAMQLTEAATELSAATGMSLDAAIKNLGKTFAGLTGELGESLPIIRTLTAEQLKAGGALQLIIDRFGGSAAAQVNTFSGRIEQLSNTWGDLLESVGLMITRSPFVIDSIGFITTEIQKLTQGIQTWFSSGGFKELLVDSANVARFFTAVLGPIFEFTIDLILKTGKALGALAASFVQLVTGEFSAAASTFKQGVIDELDIGTFNFAGTEAAVGFIDGFANAVNMAPEKIAPAMQNFRNNLNNEIATTTLTAGVLFEELFNNINNKALATKMTINDLTKTLRGSLMQGIASSFAALGSALARGENGFAAFAKAVLAALGGVAIQIGTILVAAGLGWSLIPGFQASSGAIPIGLGLIALGGALQALGGGGGGAAASVGGAPATSGAATETAPIDTGLTSNLTPDEQDPQTQVSVNIQGDVLDSEESGTRIVQLINENFSTRGGVIASGGVA